MNYSRTAAMQPKAVSAGMLLLVGGAFTLIQLASLVLGPAPSRQFNLSLAVPAVDLQDGPNSLGSPVDAVLGAIASAVPDPPHVPAIVASAPAPTRLDHPGSLPVLLASIVINSAPTVVNSAPMVGATDQPAKAGHPRHDDRGHGRGSANVPATTD